MAFLSQSAESSRQQSVPLSYGVRMSCILDQNGSNTGDEVNNTVKEPLPDLAVMG